jgi:hypothetical protein
MSVCPEGQPASGAQPASSPGSSRSRKNSRRASSAPPSDSTGTRWNVCCTVGTTRAMVPL